MVITWKNVELLGVFEYTFPQWSSTNINYSWKRRLSKPLEQKFREKAYVISSGFLVEQEMSNKQYCLMFFADTMLMTAFYKL